LPVSLFLNFRASSLSSSINEASKETGEIWEQGVLKLSQDIEELHNQIEAFNFEG
jgi:hypothetical protein